jgi:hypothetical protein
MRLRATIVAVAAVAAAAVALVGPSAGAKPKPVKPGQFVTYACAAGETAGSGTVAWVDKHGQVISTTQATASGAMLTAGPAPARAKAYEFRGVSCIPPDPNAYLTGTAPVTDQGLILYGVGIFTGLPIPGGDPNVVRDCPAGYVMDFEQSTFTETGGTDILTPELITDFGSPVIIINNSTLTEGEPTTATLEYSIACVPVA